MSCRACRDLRPGGKTLFNHKSAGEVARLSCNYSVPFRASWNNAWDNYRLVLPFGNLRKRLTKTDKKEHTVLHFDEWLSYLDRLEEYYRPEIEFMVLIGIIPTEMGRTKNSTSRGITST